MRLRTRRYLSGHNVTDDAPLYVSDLSEWSPKAEVEQFAGPLTQDDGHWEVILHRIVVDFPSLAELFEWLTGMRNELQDNGSALEIRWRWDVNRKGG